MTHFHKSILVLFVSTILYGCAVGPKYVAPQASAPSNWQVWHGGSEALASPQWRQQSDALALKFSQNFKDPTLNALLERLNSQNPDLQTAVLRLAQSRAQYASARSQRVPQVNLNANPSRQTQSENGANMRTIDAMNLPAAQRQRVIDVLAQPFDVYQAGFDASWEMDLWGRVRHSIEAANANQALAQAMLNQIRVTTNAELMRAYFELRGVQTQLALTRAQRDSANQTAQLLEAKFKAGVLDDIDTSRARIAVDDLNGQVTLLDSQAAVLMNQITLLLGDAPGSWNVELAMKSAVFTESQLPDLSLGLPSQLAQRRPDILAAQAQFQAAVANTGIAVADLYPRIVIGANVGLSSVSSEKFFDITSLQWGIGPGISIPIFDMGRRRSVVTLRELQQQEAAVNYQTTVLKAWHEVDTQLSQYAADSQRSQQLVDKSAQSGTLYKIANARYKGGLSDELSALDAQRNDLQTQREASDAVKKRFIDLVQIYKALGGSDIAKS